MKRKCVIVFGRYPWPGRTKTRLIPDLGKFGAADFQRRLTEMTLEKVRKLRKEEKLDIHFCFEGEDEHKVRRWLGKDIHYSRQENSDLGARMQGAFEQAFQRGYYRVLLLGTDIPDFTESHLRLAFKALDDDDVILGPSTDGGYWLMGLKRPGNLFEEVEWGTQKVLEQTRESARSADLTVFELAPLTDMDTIEDLKGRNEPETKPGPYLSIIIPTLNEEDTVKKTIEKAREDEVEIIVVDGGSSDRTVELARKSGVRVVSASEGRARQQNYGAGLSAGKVLLFLHADTNLPDGYAEHVFEALMEPSLLMGAFRFKTDLQKPSMRMIELLAGLRCSLLKLPYGDQAFFLRRETFESRGGFPDVPIAEDLYFARRIARRGRVITLRIPAVTSARKWRSGGIFRMTLINLLMAAGCLSGVSPDRLASFYHRFTKSRSALMLERQGNKKSTL